MRRKLIGLSLAILLMTTVLFGTMIGTWKENTMVDSQSGFSLHFSVPEPFLRLIDEDFEAQLGALGQAWYLGEEEYPDIALIILVHELAEEAYEEFWYWDAPYLEIEIEEEIEICGFMGYLVMGIDEEYEEIQWMIYLPNILEREDGVAGLIIWIVAIDEYAEYTAELFEGLIRSIQF